MQQERQDNNSHKHQNVKQKEDNISDRHQECKVDKVQVDITQTLKKRTVTIQADNNSKS